MVKKIIVLWFYVQKNYGSLFLWSKKLYFYGPMVKKIKSI